MSLLAIPAALLAGVGAGQAVAGWLAARRFRRTPDLPPGERPAVTVLKPLHGDEPMLEQALASLCAQDYPDYQIVFGVQNPADSALAVVERLRARFPGRDIAVVVDPAAHGSNHKVSNLINMLPAARHDVLVIADSDVHCAPDYLEQIVRSLAVPGTGLVTTLYAGVAATPTVAGALGASWINHSFLPGALLARRLGRQDCLGATMALRREVLASVGGLEALADYLADDHMLGRLVQQQGLAVRLAATVVSTTVPEASLRALFRHELRWARTILALVPAEFTLSALQYPLFWAVLAMALAGGDALAVALFLGVWAVRAATARAIDRTLGLTKSVLATTAPIWLFPLRDLMSITVILVSYGSDRVEWRGQVMHTGRGSAEAGVPTQANPHGRAPAT
ncbi:bacteriohopanetetrol glucosamine biosynthesis glycosyltransferase HpnI [Limobrevibacterium gyesilva]|uniref:Bacteriohopanetetrol glucosamine biosynthesis glycosyltransferase HpnI n=1 Tax=Limobrevibacterium gyesilva TaxID=2991712 RepID=A0AA41YUR0_9PROT|nr:bacteriohopanetetrol glucosamine biosynthesis glycosyltransferase HpnI [Limobrevibacterium gyesilva]MCW3476933.1 bacteriohopanetetrol glucosamine biosynthesis glycosyltransferase HpnI [Limobrevibacterium gyesilva]